MRASAGGCLTHAKREGGACLIATIARKISRVVYKRIGLEAIIWLAAFFYLAIHDPYVQAEFTLCPLENLGFHYCPGCGLGRSVSFFIHGDIARSVQTHLLGIPATIILLSRTFSLFNVALEGKVFQSSIQ